MLDKRQRKKGGKELRLEPKRKRKFGQKKHERHIKETSFNNSRMKIQVELVEDK